MVVGPIMVLSTLLLLTSTVAAASAKNPSSVELGPSTFTVPGAFPTSIYKHYYNNPTATSAQVQPVITDPVTVSVLSTPLIELGSTVADVLNSMRYTLSL